MSLKKWVSNSPELLASIAPEDRLRPTWLLFSTGGPVNELGMAWDPNQDCLKFAPPGPSRDGRPTKRTILAELARIFDPAGWLTRITVFTKIFVQDLWRATVDWDVSVSQP